LPKRINFRAISRNLHDYLVPLQLLAPDFFFSFSSPALTAGMEELFSCCGALTAPCWVPVQELAQPVKASPAPDARPAMQSPASIFFSA